MINLFDLKFSISRLCADYKFTFTVVFTMALGLAVSLFLFAQIYSMGYKDLPFRDGDRIVSVARYEAKFAPPTGGLQHYEVRYFFDNQSSLDQLSAFESSNSIISTEEFTESFNGARIAGDFFALVGVDAQLGRTLVADDYLPGSPNVLVISDKIWQKLFQRSPEVIGTQVNLAGWKHTIVGVMPKGFAFPVAQDFWARFDQMNVMVPNGAGWLSVIGRLKPGVSVTQAEDDFKNLSAEINKLYPTEFNGKSVHLDTLPALFSENNKLVVSSMTIVAVAILLMGCASIANLLIVRMLEQRKDTMVKLAVGLPFWRVALVPILESFWLCLISGLLGMALCILGIKFAGQFAFSALGPFWWDIKIDGTLWAAGGLFVFVIWIITGSLPVIMSLKTPTNSVLAGGRKGGGSKSGPFMTVLVSAQVLCAFLLMTITGLATYNLIETLTADYGINPSGYLTTALKPESSTYPNVADRVNYFRKLEQELMSLGEVESVAFLSALPGRFTNNGVTYSLPNRDMSSSTELPRGGGISTDIKAFDNLNIKLIDGRAFNESDTFDSEPVVIINQSLAKDLWPDDSAVGKQLQLDPDKRGPLVTIVGVAPDVTYGYPNEFIKTWNIFYQPMTQMQHAWLGMEAAIKIRGDLQKAIPKLKEAARKVDSETPLLDLIPYEQRLDRNANGVKTLIYNFLPAAILAMIMAAVGIYGISARLVLQRTSDIGIMRAIGAKDFDINKLFLTKSIWQLVGGVIPGVILLFLLLPQLLEQLEMTKGVFTILALLVISVVATIVIFASYLPVRRANQLSPQEALNGG